MAKGLGAIAPRGRRRFADGGVADALSPEDQAAMMPETYANPLFKGLVDRTTLGPTPTDPNDPVLHRTASPLVNVTQGDIDRAIDVGMGAGPGSIKPIRAYHGSPHDFDRFDLSKIGTGEGAQAYGHGLYFAESEGVAKSYRDALAGRKTDWASPEFASQYDPGTLAALQRDLVYKSPDEIMAMNKQYSDYARKTGQRNLMGDMHDALANGHLNKGRMYEVNINADPAHFLDWDKPIGNQPQKVYDAVSDILARHRDQRIDSNAFTNDKTGQDFARRVARPSYPIQDAADAPFRASGASTFDEALGMVGGDKMRVRKVFTPDPAYASQSLHEAGIPGIKYLDQGSRTAGEGSSNYVVFNDKLIDIMRKYAAAGIALPPAIAAEYEQMKQQPPGHFALGGLSQGHVGMPNASPTGLGGLIASPVAGRTDRLPMNVKPNSYVIPADVVSGLGQGNTMAGGRILDAMLKHGPYGSAPSVAHGHGNNIPKPPAKASFADGGATGDVPIIVAGGEYHVDPEIVAAMGGGDANKGHELLDKMVISIRKQTIKQLKNLPGPVK